VKYLLQTDSKLATIQIKLATNTPAKNFGRTLSSLCCKMSATNVYTSKYCSIVHQVCVKLHCNVPTPLKLKFKEFFRRVTVPNGNSPQYLEEDGSNEVRK